ncbi:PRC-barrel domain-containing protein [Thalassobacillus hwangdonensis]|uniref:PRC-barrel domain-containing protein n=1 Tax=Thalassobacillus hwangdonensis TaxID=546108 RepID=A0ABW3KZ65_9BACI
MLKKSKELVGLPIISITEGKEIGSVKSLVVNPEKGMVDFLAVEHEDWHISMKAIPFKKIVGIGEYAITVENQFSILDLNEIPIANQLINQKISIIDTKVMTRLGQLVGKANEYYIEQEKGEIVAVQIETNQETVYLQSDDIITYGENLLILNEAYTTSSEFDADVLIPATEETTTEVYQQETPAIALDRFDQKQTELLAGKEATKDIIDQQGEVVVAAGTRLSEEDLKRVREIGPSLMVDLSMNVR